ncbi:MAG: glycosyl transferase [Micavibrio aeruginosavorus]|uniref:Glycosyl transferase n=1 Tax=Micavibrio aeruginosavorus TaxID=349221 RepID=A0A2W5N2Q5_9BACT|nr:MAG: glycosyl transferase [Micavibrio aeruginosavorus]
MHTKADAKGLGNAASTRKPPVVMQIIPALGAGGAEQGCIDVAAELVKSGAKSIVVSHGGHRIPEILRGGSTHINLPVHSKNPFVLWRNVGRLRKLIREHDVDIVHARSRAPAWSAWKAVENTKARFMTTCHAPFNISGSAKKFYNSSIARGERVIAISNYVREYLLKNYEIEDRNIRVIHRGVAVEKFHPGAVAPTHLIKLSNEWRLPDGCTIVMMPGRLTRWKGHLVLIDAMAKLKRDDVFCVMIGDDQGRSEYRAEVEAAIKEKGLEGRARIVGHCSDMPAAYMLANVVVSASTDPEGFGRIPIEAQAMGRPIVATNHGGAMETIIAGETGWLVEPGNADALAAAIEEALTLDPERRSIMATHAMMHIADNFTRSRMVDETMDVYAELLREKFTGVRVDPPQLAPPVIIVEEEPLKAAAE